MTISLKIIDFEISNITYPEFPQGASEAIGELSFDITAKEDSSSLLMKCSSLLLQFDHLLIQQGDRDNIQRILPEWFMISAMPEPDKDELAKWLKIWDRMPYSEKLKLSKSEGKWSASNWIHAMLPEQRAWFWKGASTTGRQKLRCDIWTVEWPCPTSAFEWMWYAAGANSVTEFRGT